MKTIQLYILSFIVVFGIACKKDNNEQKSTDSTSAVSTPYSFSSIEVDGGGSTIVFDQFSKQGNTITAKKKSYFKRSTSSVQDDSIEFTLTWQIDQFMNAKAQYSVNGPEVKISFSYITSVPDPKTTWTHSTVSGAIQVESIDQANKKVKGTFNWDGNIDGAQPTATQHLTNGTFELIY